MYLKSLELFGFKSFAPKTILEFHRGVTCVVGPNGCGKSNVLDAIRWVLGEQSAKALRGGEMADVIFSGTDSRAAVGMAEVSMTFAECEEALGLDWHEVTLTRRVFRDGGSEYLLNKTPCRLKDIHQMFMDTGIGRSAYSIMEQGKIDAILSSRPEDRRAIFEEAAGITKYKSQKREALRKLEATEANLLRLADIIKEVKRQIGSLQRQAGKARRYQTLLGDLKLLETHSAKNQWDTLEAQREEAANEIKRLAEKQTGSEQEIERQESEVAVQRAALQEMEARLNGARQTVNDLKTRIANHESRIVFNNERTGEFRGLIERYRADIAQAAERFRVQEEQLHSTDAELEQITALLASELRVMEEKQAATSALTAQRSEIEQASNAAAQDAARIENRISGLRGQASNLNQQREAAEARLSFLAEEGSQLEFAFSQLLEHKTTTESELARMEAELAAHTAAATAAEMALREAQTTLAAIERELRDAQRLLAEKESKAEVIRQLVESGEGFDEGTQAVLRGLDNPDFFKPAVLGALAQFLEVAPEFVPAVEAALGTNLQAIVMKDSMIAESVVRTLSVQKLGKAALALRELDRHFENVPNEQMTLPEGAIDWLINKVNPQPEVARLVERLVNHTILVPDLDTAMRLFPQRGSLIVTLAGEVLTPNGILHGGTQSGAAHSMLERKNQLHVLDAEAAAARSNMWEISSRRETTLSGIEGTQVRLDEAREEKQNAALQVSTIRGQLGTIEREAKDTERKQQTLESERAGSEARLAEAAQRSAALDAEIDAAVQHLEATQARRAEAQNQFEILRAQENELAGELNELKIKVATERQRHSSLHHQRAPMEARLRELNELMEQRRIDATNYEQRIESTAAENAEIEGHLGGLRGQVGESELSVAQLLDERANIAATAEELGNTLRILRHQLSECHDQRSRLEVKQTQLEMRATAIHEHIQKRYQLDLHEFERDLHGLRVAIREAQKRRNRAGSGDASETDSASASPADEAVVAEPEAPVAIEPESAFAIDWSILEAMVKDLDARLDSMGPVNLDAIQEFDELEQRYNFLEQQNTDTINAKTELLATITKINQTTRTLFAETFEKIRVNFAEMFTELFGGGKANLVLTDESDPLESGIDIIAKPPGKQLTSITLLSGGEKTMTAVALLFSIYMVKPSPFCVLDEMDAPLDESNINRFIKILDRFVDQSQFVVISHNKRTIARADAIYGVTMEEHGVSKLVGVKFSKRDGAGSDRIDVLSNSDAAPVLSVAETFGKSPNLASDDAMANGAA
jgi:chromosome segregation protein